MKIYFTLSAIGIIFFTDISYGSYNPFEEARKYVEDKGKNLTNVKPEDFDCFNKNSECRKGLRNLDQQRLDLMKKSIGPLCVTNSEVVYRRNTNNNRGISRIQRYYLEKYFGNIVYKTFFVWNSLLNDHVTFQGKTLTHGSEAQTYGYDVYLSDINKENNTEQLITMAHELAHVKQFHEQYSSNINKYCDNYMWQWLNASFEYFDIQMEKDAFKEEYQFARWLVKELEQYPSIERGYHFSSQSPYLKRSIDIQLPITIDLPQNYQIEEARKIEEARIEEARKIEEARRIEMNLIDNEYSNLNIQAKKETRPPAITPEMKSAREKLELFLKNN